MATYAELQAQIARLEEEAEVARRQEIAGVVAQIHELARQYALVPEDLGFTSPGASRRRRTTPVAAKYRDPQTGATWSGRGRAPRWLVGVDRAAFAIKQLRTETEAMQDAYLGPTP